MAQHGVRGTTYYGTVSRAWQACVPTHTVPWRPSVPSRRTIPAFSTGSSSLARVGYKTAVPYGCGWRTAEHCAAPGVYGDATAMLLARGAPKVAKSHAPTHHLVVLRCDPTNVLLSPPPILRPRQGTSCFLALLPLATANAHPPAPSPNQRRQPCDSLQLVPSAFAPTTILQQPRNTTARYCPFTPSVPARRRPAPAPRPAPVAAACWPWRTR